MKFFDPLAWRPAVVLAMTLAAGLASPSTPLWAIFAAILVPLLSRWSARAVGVAGLILGFLIAPLPPRPVEPQTGEFHVRVATFPRPIGGGATFIAEVERQRVATWVKSDRIALGDELEVRGSLRPLQRGPDDFLLTRAVAGRLSVRSFEVSRSGPAWAHTVADLSRSLGERLRARLGEGRGQLAGALAFNLNGELTPEADAVLRRSGAYHLVSASGLHAALLAGFLAWLGTRLPIPRPVAIGLSILILLGYSVLTGWHPATVRSALMWGLGAAAYMARRLPDALSALGGFVAVWLSINPLDVYDTGFGLTIVVTSAIVAVRVQGPLRLGDLGTGIVAWLATEPIAMMQFGRATPLAVPANVALGLASEVVLVLSALVALPPFGFLAGITGACVDGFYAIARTFGHPVWAYWPTPWMNPTLAASLYMAMLLLWLALEQKRRRRREA